MGSSNNRNSGFSSVAYTNGKIPASSFPFVSNSSSVASGGKQKTDEVVSHHQRCLSESLLIEEEPFWLEDLLREPVTAKGHRRSASDSYAYLGFNVIEDLATGTSYHVSGYTSPNSPDEMIHKASHESNGGASVSSEKHNKEESSTQNPESSSSSQQNPSTSKAEAKRAKQQSAHRSRVRKLQQINELERTVQALQVEESMVSAELEFLDQHNLILSMETRALRQRLDCLSQEYFLKQMEQEMLERELVRVQALYQLQRQRPIPPLPQHRRSKSREFLEGQFPNISLKNNDVSPGCPVRIQ